MAARIAAVSIEIDRPVAMVTRGVLPGMTLCTIRHVGRVSVGNDFRICRMTLNARQRCAVITRIVWRRVHEDTRPPYVRRMAFLAVARRHEVGRWLAGRRYTVVTADAIAGHTRVVEPQRRLPRQGRVTLVALGGRLQVVRRFARRRHTVVAARAASQNVCVIDHDDRFPEVRRMTVFADVVGQDVFRSFAGSGYAVVASVTPVNDSGVIEPRDRSPGERVVARTAVI